MAGERNAKSRRRRRTRRLVGRWIRRVLTAAFAAAAIAFFSLWLVLRHYEEGLPSTEELKDYDPPQVTRVLARDGTLLAELFVERRTLVPIAKIPKVMKLAVLAAEDADFYRHEGLDYLGMLRALIVNLRSQSARQGGSTITQQVVKNVLLTHERTFERKAREVLLARRIEQQLEKDEILELYLNHIYFGHGRYGVEEACRYYFGKSISEVTLSEAALIAGLPKGPSHYSPRIDPERAKRRRDVVLDQMHLKGFARAPAVAAAKQSPIALAPATEALPELAPEAVEEARRVLEKVAGPKARTGGYTIETTIDPGLQADARRAVRDNLDAYAKRHDLLAPIAAKKGRKPFQGTPASSGHHIYDAVVLGADDEAGTLKVRVGSAEGVVHLSKRSRYNPKGLPPSHFAEEGAIVRVSPIIERGIGPDGVPHTYRLELGPQGALVAIDVDSRQILALVGSYEAIRGGLDRASFARRQPGSTFKPFVYGYGIHARELTPVTPVGPSPEDDEQPPLLLREALARSVNEAATHTLERLGPESVVRWAHRAGIASKLAPTESLALGAYEVRPRELAAAYTTFAGGGTYEPPTLIRRIVAPDGSELPLPDRPAGREVMTPAEAYLLTDLLGSVIEAGTGRAAAKLDLPLAGKTGTSNRSRDAWFAGYSPEIAAVVWTGYDDAISLGRGEHGSRAALPAWMGFMKAAHDGREVRRFERPRGVIAVAVDPETGLLPYEGQEEVRTELFLRGTAPTQIREPPEPEDIYADGSGGAPPDEAEADEQAEAPTARAEPPPAEAEPPPF